MFSTAVAVLLWSFFAGRIQCEPLVQTVLASVNQSCSPLETACALGCCPYEDGICCADGHECCEHGKACIPFIGLCIGAVNNNDEISTTSSKSTGVRRTLSLSEGLSLCPNGTFECEPNRCCIYPHGECCWDGEHCCPYGFRCDVKHQTCKQLDTTNETGRKFYSTAAFDERITKLKRKSPYKSCRGGDRICPSYMNCCVNENGEWTCCPNPFLSLIYYGRGECCDTIYGRICCPNDYPTCTVMGCTK